MPASAVNHRASTTWSATVGRGAAGPPEVLDDAARPANRRSYREALATADVPLDTGFALLGAVGRYGVWGIHTTIASRSGCYLQKVPDGAGENVRQVGFVGE